MKHIKNRNKEIKHLKVTDKSHEGTNHDKANHSALKVHGQKVSAVEVQNENFKETFIG